MIAADVLSMAPGSAAVDEPAPARTVAGLDSDEMATNEQRTIPWGAGTFSVPGLWIGQVFDQYTLDAPADRPGKK